MRHNAGFSGGGRTAKRANAGAAAERDSACFMPLPLELRLYADFPPRQKAGLKYRLQKTAAALTKQAFLQPLPPLPAEQEAQLEIARLRAFKAAGLPAAEILTMANGFAAPVPPGQTIAEILAALRGRDARLHDGLLIRCAQALGQAHAAGLCLGQADLSKMFLARSGVGFSGFHDYPEEVMPQAAAQLRDIWQMLPLLCAAALDKDAVAAQAFRAWRQRAGLDTLENLRAAARLFRLVLKPYAYFAALMPARQRAERLRVLRFLAANLGI